MLKKYLSKFTIDILPSIMATVVGAYIVNHYIVPKATGDRPAAALSKAAADSTAAEPARAVDSTESGNAAEAAPAKARNADSKAADSKPADSKAADKPETASAPEQRRHAPGRDKVLAKATAAAPAAAPAPAQAAAPVVAAPADTGSADERRDANDLARAAIERLSRSESRAAQPPRPQEAARAPAAEARVEPKLQEAVRTVPATSLQQLPPPIMVTTPSVERLDTTATADRPEGSRGFRPPGEIPQRKPADLQADASNARPQRTNVAEDVLSAAKNVFNSVVPHPFD